MKARKVKGLKGKATLRENAAKILVVRTDELRSFVPAAFDPAEVEKLHDLRIAAKRLRYILEAVGRPCFGDAAVETAKRVKELQDVVGEIHDCDVMLPWLAQREGEGIDALVAHVQARREERFGAFLALWPEVEALATRFSHPGDIDALPSEASP